MAKVYARVRKIGTLKLVHEVFSDRLIKPTDDDVLIEEGNGPDYIHVQNRYVLFDESMLHNYKIVNNKMVKTTVADKRKEQGLLPLPEETPEQKIETNTYYIYELSEQLLNAEKQSLEKSQEIELVKGQLASAQQDLELHIALNEEISNYVLDLDTRITNIENL